MKEIVPKEYFDAFACPSCQSCKLLLTKEKIIICQDCLTGYRMRDEAPDFRMEHAIVFKKGKDSVNKKNNALFTVLIGDNRHETFDLKHGHCVLLGRMVHSEFDEDKTTVLKPGFSQLTHFTRINEEHHKLLEKYLSKTSHKMKQTNPQNQDSAFNPSQKYIGDFVRERDFLIKDPSVSRSHAIIYQDDEGVKVLDLVSKNGTYLNGREVESGVLKNNDVLSVGTSTLRVNFY